MQRYAQRYTFFVRNFEKPYTEQYYKHEMRLNQPVAFIYRITRELLIMDQGHHYGKVQITQYKQLYKKLEIVKAVQLYYEEKNDLPLSLNELTGIDPIDPFTGKAYNYRKGIRFFVLSSDRSDIPVGAGRHLQQSIFNFSIKY